MSDTHCIRDKFEISDQLRSRSPGHTLGGNARIDSTKARQTRAYSPGNALRFSSIVFLDWSQVSKNADSTIMLPRLSDLHISQKGLKLMTTPCVEQVSEKALTWKYYWVEMFSNIAM